MKRRKILNKIQQLQWDKNLSDQDVADKAKMDKSAINRIKNGMRSPTQKSMLKIAYSLDTPTEIVFELDWRKLDKSDFM